MKLQSVNILNYRSIEDISFDLAQLADGTYTYGLIGVNEAGKSSILKALGLKDGLKNIKGEPLPLSKDFRDRNEPIEVIYNYVLEKADIQAAQEKLKSALPDLDITSVDLTKISLRVSFPFSNPTQPQFAVEIMKTEDFPDVSEVENQLKELIIKKAHKSVFWTAEDRYLISHPINLAQFAASPADISIPLKNCFALAGMNTSLAIQERIALITESTEREQLKSDLSEKVTSHVNNVWKKHPISITFDISDGLINFHVHDTTRGKAKTADQRSDGFGQFVSFLLTISAQNKNEELSETVLLIDEPETHLHPQAQEDLLKELITITQNKRNNVAFFATHSNYMIDKNDLSRNYKIYKVSDKKAQKEQTQAEQFNQKTSTYASVTYEVFDIPSTDYHNELYSKLHEKYQDEDLADDKRGGILNFDKNYLFGKKALKQDKPWKGSPNKATLATYIRNCIHHSDNGDTYKEEDLRKSIELLRSYL